MSDVLGIGIITYNRKDFVIKCVERLRAFTTVPYTLMVADDGSTDGTAEWCRENGITVVHGPNKTVCWNKNRALFTLMNFSNADPVLLLEDDCWPVEDTWAQTWIEAAKTWNHMNFKHPAWGRVGFIGGRGMINNPWRYVSTTGQATISTRAALQKVGYLDVSFQGYGYGHVEWTYRFVKAKLLKNYQILCICGGLKLEPGPSYFNRTTVIRNRTLLFRKKPKPFQYMPPWHSTEQRAELELEVANALRAVPLQVWDRDKPIGPVELPNVLCPVPEQAASTPVPSTPKKIEEAPTFTI